MTARYTVARLSAFGLASTDPYELDERGVERCLFCRFADEQRTAHLIGCAWAAVVDWARIDETTGNPPTPPHIAAPVRSRRPRARNEFDLSPKTTTPHLKAFTQALEAAGMSRPIDLVGER